MKILHVTPHYEPAFEMGGVVRSASQLCRGLVRLGADATVFTTNNRRSNRKLDVSINQQINVGGVRVWYFPIKYFHKKFFYSPELGIACYDKIKEFDIMHLTSFWCYPGIPAGKAARKFGIPYIVSTRGTLVPYCLKQGMLKKKIYMSLFDRKNLEGASAIHYTTELERESTHMYNGLVNPSFIIPNPVPLNEFSNMPNRNAARNHFSIPQDSYVISYVGRLHSRKALDVLVHSFMKILPHLSNNCYLLIAGPDDGNERRLKQLVMKNGLNGKVRFLGFVDPKQRGFVLKASDLFWYATHPGENFGHSAVEAMAAGVPVILTEHVGISREVIEDKAGIIVSHNPEEIAGRILELIHRKDRWRQMSENAKRCVYRFDSDKVVPLFLKACEDILTGTRSPELQWK
jgi:glycosyltransferase involved in cell wall biosynthesis